MVARGIVSAVNDAGGIQLVQVRLNPNETIDNVPRAAEYGFTSVPPEGSDAVLVFGAGDRSNGVVIGTGNAKFRLAGLKSGEAAMHDNTGLSVYLTSEGIVINGGGREVKIINTPLLSCTGDILDNEGENTVTMAQMRSAHNGHVHGGVERGGGDTDPPTVLE